jgi:hypothetical protein
MQYYGYRIDRKVYRCNMFKDTCLVALKRKDKSPHIFGLESLCILDLVILIYLLVWSSFVDYEMNLLMIKHIITQMQQS